MMQQLIGREKEQKRIEDYSQSHKSEFVAVYGRRRVGKTFLIRQCFQDDFTFKLTGLANVGKKEQLAQFHAAFVHSFPTEDAVSPASDWFTAFGQLRTVIEKIKRSEKKIIFIDELPWLDTKGAHFLSAIEHFWNDWASTRNDILLIVCGSAASWMIKNLLNNKGGLHNRVTGRIKLAPFNLAETEAFLQYKNVVYNRYQIIQLYMVFGGIPFYLEQINGSLSASQNINELCFEKHAPFRTEYQNLFASLFNKWERHTAIVEALSKKNKGLNRAMIIKQTKLADGGGLTRILTELEESGFIRKYRAFGKKERDSLYQLTDLFTLFYLNFIKKSSADDENHWINALQTPAYRAWSGYAFEMIGLLHIAEIKQALGISGVQTSVSAWQSNHAQIDLVIDRKDQVINLCEMKFSINPFAITKSYEANLRNKIGSFQTDTQTKKALFLTLISPYGLAQNKYAGIVQNDFTMDDLFK